MTIAYTNWEAFEKNCPGGKFGYIFCLLCEHFQGTMDETAPQGIGRY